MKFKFPLLSGVLVLVVAAGWLVMTIPHCAHTDISPPTIPSTVSLQNPQDSPALPATNAAMAVPPISNPSPSVPEVLIAGGLELPVIFTDGVSDTELRQLIMKDINLVYGHLTDHESLLPIYKNRLRIEGRDVSPIAQLNFVGIGRYFPKELNALMGIIVDLGGQKMVVPPELANIYAASEIKLKKYPQAFNQMEVFIERLNRLSEEAASPRDLFFLHPSAKEFAPALQEMSQEQIVEGFGNCKYRRPSVIEIKEMDESIPELKGALVAPIYRVITGGISDTSTPLVFHEGRWKLMIARF
jgi:hypothetical protein